MNYLYDDFITEVEGFAAPIYKKLVEKQIQHEREKFDFAFFLGLMYSRTPAMRRMTGEMRSRYIQIFVYAYAARDGAFEGLVNRFEKAEGTRLSDEQKTQLKREFIDPSSYKIALPSHLLNYSTAKSCCVKPCSSNNWQTIFNCKNSPRVFVK